MAHFLWRQGANDGLRQNLLHEHVHDAHHEPADAWGPHELEAHLEVLRKLGPTDGAKDALHARDALHVVFVAHGVVKPEAGSPVVKDQGNVLEPHRLDKTVEILHVIDKVIADVRLVGLPHADQIGGDAPPARGHVRNDVAP